MADRLSHLHAELDAVRAAVAALEARLAALEQDRPRTGTGT
jgi:ubiquinone biosynthesis protein UbiJ